MTCLLQHHVQLPVGAAVAAQQVLLIFVARGIPVAVGNSVYDLPGKGTIQSLVQASDATTSVRCRLGGGRKLTNGQVLLSAALILLI